MSTWTQQTIEFCAVEVTTHSAWSESWPVSLKGFFRQFLQASGYPVLLYHFVSHTSQLIICYYPHTLYMTLY